MKPKESSSGNYIFEVSPSKALLKLGIPMLFGMLAMTLFNVVDTWYVAKLGTIELAAISFTFPVIMLLNGITLGVGIGLTSVVSNKVGAGEKDKVRAYVRDGLVLSLLIVIIITTAGVFTIEPLFKLIGADNEILPLVKDYMLIWYLGTAAVVFPMVGNSAIRGTGDAVTPAWIMSFAFVLNIVLDPLLIFGVGPFPELGLKGAAIATVISRVLAMIASLYMLIYKLKLIEMQIPDIKGMLYRWKKIMEVGAVAALTHLITPLAGGIITKIVATYGPTAVAAFGAGTRIEMFAAMFPVSLGSGLIVYAGQHWGAKKYGRLLQGINVGQRMVLGSGVAIYILILLLAEPIGRLFTTDTQVLKPLVFYLRFVLVALSLESLLAVGVSLFNGIHRPQIAFQLNLMRMIVFMLPLAWAGGYLGGNYGLFIGMACAKVLTGLFTAYRIFRFNKEVRLKPEFAE